MRGSNSISGLALLVLLQVAGFTIHGLDLQSVEDGVCTSATPDPNFNKTWFETAPLHYLMAGSKHHLYTMIWGYSDFDLLRESEFYYYSCTTGSIDFVTNNAIVHAFNNTPVARCYNFQFPAPGVLQLQQDQLPNNYETLNAIKYITLTDNRTYMFFHICITNWNLKSWMVYATVPELDQGTMMKIQLHALKLGHSWGDMAFVRYDSCELGSPILEK